MLGVKPLHLGDQPLTCGAPEGLPKVNIFKTIIKNDALRMVPAVRMAIRLLHLLTATFGGTLDGRIRASL
ncbi:MAG: hypothetical protein AAFO96_29420 [Bacteroidota bacterium]